MMLAAIVAGAGLLLVKAQETDLAAQIARGKELEASVSGEEFIALLEREYDTAADRLGWTPASDNGELCCDTCATLFAENQGCMHMGNYDLMGFLTSLKAAGGKKCLKCRKQAEELCFPQLEEVIEEVHMEEKMEGVDCNVCKRDYFAAAERLDINGCIDIGKSGSAEFNTIREEMENGLGCLNCRSTYLSECNIEEANDSADCEVGGPLRSCVDDFVAQDGCNAWRNLDADAISSAVDAAGGAMKCVSCRETVAQECRINIPALYGAFAAHQKRNTDKQILLEQISEDLNELKMLVAQQEPFHFSDKANMPFAIHDYPATECPIEKFDFCYEQFMTVADQNGQDGCQLNMELKSSNKDVASSALKSLFGILGKMENGKQCVSCDPQIKARCGYTVEAGGARCQEGGDLHVCVKTFQEVGGCEAWRKFGQTGDITELTEKAVIATTTAGQDCKPCRDETAVACGIDLEPIYKKDETEGYSTKRTVATKTTVAPQSVDCKSACVNSFVTVGGCEAWSGYAELQRQCEPDGNAAGKAMMNMKNVMDASDNHDNCMCGEFRTERFDACQSVFGALTLDKIYEKTEVCAASHELDAYMGDKKCRDEKHAALCFNDFVKAAGQEGLGCQLTYEYITTKSSDSLSKLLAIGGKMYRGASPCWACSTMTSRNCYGQVMAIKAAEKMDVHAKNPVSNE